MEWVHRVEVFFVGVSLGVCIICTIVAWALRRDDRWAHLIGAGFVFACAIAVLFLAGCASRAPIASDLDWQTNYRLVRIVYVGSPVDFATQHLCPVGDAVYTVFEDVVDHSRLWRCSPPRGYVGDVVSLYE